MTHIEDVLEKRILVLDGAMGTMIQGFGFEEADFRGEQFKKTILAPSKATMIY